MIDARGTRKIHTAGRRKMDDELLVRVNLHCKVHTHHILIIRKDNQIFL